MRNIYIMQTGKLYMDGLAFENWPNIRQQLWAFKAYMLMIKKYGVYPHSRVLFGHRKKQSTDVGISGWLYKASV